MVANAVIINDSFQYNYSGYKTIENGIFESSYEYEFPFDVMGTDETFNISFNQSYPISYFENNGTYNNQTVDFLVSFEFDENNETILGLNFSFVYPYTIDETYSMNFSFEFPDQNENKMIDNTNDFIGFFGTGVLVYSIYQFIFG